MTRLNPLRHITNSNPLVSNTRWMFIAEGLARASRLVTIIALASLLSSSDYGVAMLAIVCYELLRVITRLGSGAIIIQCTDTELASTASNAYLLNWIICLLLAVFQYFISPVIANFYQKPLLEPLLQLMAVSYLIYPIVTVRACLLQRNNKMKYFALFSALSVMTDNLSTALLVWLGFGVYAVAIAKIAAALVWLILFSFVKPPHFKPTYRIAEMRRLIIFSCKVLASDLLKTSRNQVDVLLAGKLLSPELFGLYSFSKSAGVGLGQALSNAYLSCIYPRMAALHREQCLASGLHQIFTIAFIISLIFVTQSILAPVYIPFLFHNDWQNPSTLVMILCLCAIPCLIIDICALILRIQHLVNQEISLQAVTVISLIVILLTYSPNTPLSFALCTVAVNFSWLLILPLYFISKKQHILTWRLSSCQQ